MAQLVLEAIFLLAQTGVFIKKDINSKQISTILFFGGG